MISEDLTDYSQYGTFDNKPFIPSYNRAERRKYIKEHKHCNWYCPYCSCNVDTITDDNCNICCILCGKIIGVGNINVEPKDYTTHIER